jgi:hypothetical protein
MQRRMVDSCRVCPNCQRGLEQYCEVYYRLLKSDFKIRFVIDMASLKQ